jgi:DNA-binding NarL/FixJ family response regulator
MRVFILDDHAVFRVGLKSVLARDDWEVVGEAGTAREAFPLIDAARPEVVVLDLVLPGMDGCSAARELRRRVPDARILMFTLSESAHDVRESFDAGAAGYALKSDPLAAFFEALRQITHGQHYMAPRLLHILQRDNGLGAPPALTALSDREREVFRLTADGLVNGEIAHELCISRKTVETHKYRIQKKIGLRGPADLVRYAVKHGMIRRPQSHAGWQSRGD